MWDYKLCEKEPDTLASAMRRRGGGLDGHVGELTDKLRERRRLIAEIDAANADRKRAAGSGNGDAREAARDLRARTASLKDALTPSKKRSRRSSRCCRTVPMSRSRMGAARPRTSW